MFQMTWNAIAATAPHFMSALVAPLVGAASVVPTVAPVNASVAPVAAAAGGCACCNSAIAGCVAIVAIVAIVCICALACYAIMSHRQQTDASVIEQAQRAAR